KRIRTRPTRPVEGEDPVNGIHVAFEGTLGADAELRYTATGTRLLSFRVAVTENRPNGDGAETQWISCSAWEDLAEQHAETLKKGREVYVEGKLRLGTWTTSDGEQRSALNCSVRQCALVGAIGRKAPKPRHADGRTPHVS